MKIKMYSSIISFKLNRTIEKKIFWITFNNIEELDEYLQVTKPALKSHRLCDNIKCQPGADIDGRPASEGCIGEFDPFNPFNRSYISRINANVNKN